jgi:xanthosine utilization system XapX-like protein
MDEFSTTMLLGVPERDYLVYVGFKGTIALLDVNSPSSPIVAQARLLYYGIYQGIYAYQLVRKPATPFIYIGNLIGSTIQKVDYTALQTAQRIVSGPSRGYESLTIANGVELAAVSSNGVSLDLFDLNTDTFSKSLTLLPAWAEIIIRSVEAYPRIKAKNYYLAPATNRKAYFFCSEAGTIEKTYAITVQNPELAFYIPNTSFMLLTYYATLQFLDMERDDSASALLTMTISSVYYSVDFVPFEGKTYLTLSVYRGLATVLIDTAGELCHFSCAGCSRSFDETACLACKPGYALAAGKCAPLAPEGSVVTLPATVSSSCLFKEYASVDRECRPCSVDCLSCKDFTGFCTSCDSSKAVTTQGTCAAACEPNEYELMVGPQRFCRRCHPSCGGCTGPTSDQCSGCDPTKPFTLVPTPQGRCKDSCDPASIAPFYSTLQAMCISCGRNCVECGFQGLYYSCRRCRPGFWIQSGECVTSCPVGMLANTATGHCEYCEEKGLDTIYFNGICIKASDCPAGNAVVNLTCRPATNSSGSPSPPVNENPVFPGRPNDQDNGSANGSDPDGNSTTIWTRTDKNTNKVSTGGLILFCGLAICACLILAAVYCLTRKSRARNNVGQTGQPGEDQGGDLRRSSSIPITLVNLPKAASSLLKKLNPFSSSSDKKQQASGTWQVFNPHNAKSRRISKLENLASSPVQLRQAQTGRSEDANSNEPIEQKQLQDRGLIPVFSDGSYVTGTFRPKKFKLALND